MDENDNTTSLFTTIDNFVSNHYKAILITIFMIIFLFLFAYLCIRIDRYLQNQEKHQEEVKQPTVMTPAQSTNPNYLQNTKDMNKDDATKTAIIIERAQQGTTQPSSTVIVTAPNPTQAAEQVKERIIQQDPTMPKEALDKSDRTIVSTQPENKDYQVGVYKINLSKRWSIGTGIGSLDGQTYIPITAERLYKNNRSLEIQANYNTSKNKFDGGQIVHKWYF